MTIDLDDKHERVWLYRLKPQLVRVEDGMPKQMLDPKILAERFRENSEQEWLLTLGPGEALSARDGVLPFLIVPGDLVLFQLRGTGVVCIGRALGASQIPSPNLRWTLRFEIAPAFTTALLSSPLPDAMVDAIVPGDAWNNLVEVSARWDDLRDALRARVAPRGRARTGHTTR
jgi:hypothetical protein